MTLMYIVMKSLMLEANSHHTVLTNSNQVEQRYEIYLKKLYSEPLDHYNCIGSDTCPFLGITESHTCII